MTPTRIVHVSREPFDVYIGRGVPRHGLSTSKWANPIKIGPLVTREIAIQEYRKHLLSRPELVRALPELQGKILGCWCAPEACHGDVPAELADCFAEAAAGATPILVWAGSVGCYYVDQYGASWSTVTCSGGLVCEECGRKMTSGYVRGYKAGERTVCGQHVKTLYPA